VPCRAVRCGAVRCGAVQCSAVQCGAVRCGAVQCGAVQCSVWAHTACASDIAYGPMPCLGGALPLCLPLLLPQMGDICASLLCRGWVTLGATLRYTVESAYIPPVVEGGHLLPLCQQPSGQIDSASETQVTCE
jgi:hypothetical protein